jgi:putative PIN family toxin of toxin-antitoxin system
LRCVLDTNVLISALLLPDSKPRRALDLVLRSGALLVSLPLLSELHQVLSRSRFHRYVDEEDAHDFVAALAREAEWVEIAVEIDACRDAKDNKILELAASGSATHIVTGDSDLLALNPFRGISIVPPQMFLQSFRPNR